MTKVATLPGHGEIKNMEKNIKNLNKTIYSSLHVHKQVAQQRMETLHQWKGCATL